MLLEKVLYDRYGIYTNAITNIGRDYLVFSEGEMYLVRPIDRNIKGNLGDMVAMWELLLYYGETNMAGFVKNKEGKRQLIPVDDKEAVVLSVPGLNEGMMEHESLGRRLAQFHQLGRFYKPDKNKEFTPWKDRWERRLDQLESWFVHIMKKKRKTPIDEEFCLTFPYFMGVTENAIQYLTDIVIDYPQAAVNQYLTICHNRFKESTWLTVEEGNSSRVKVPTDFIYDHFTRDLGEYIRYLWLEYGWTDKCREEINDFLNDYESIYPLSSAEQMQLIGRLMFPSHYFDHIERYYETNDEKWIERCLTIFNTTDEYEKVIVYVAKQLQKQNEKLQLPDWLKDKQTTPLQSTATF
ncbi:MAG: spore coat protein YutH [Bacillus sp. (in: Bacteria)]|nr:spore coat protein YutH [Bacillus sp. (in: firmicutes)]